MAYLRPSLSVLYNPVQSSPKMFPATILLAGMLLAVGAGFAQEQPQAPENSGQSEPTQNPSATVTIPAGTRIVLVLTHPVQSRVLHRGDDIYAQVTAPVSVGDQVVIPPGTFVQGIVDKLEERGGRGELHLQSMAITFPDGYTAAVPGPMTLLSDEGYALKDPGKGRVMSAVALPLAGAGVGALIGHAAANTSPQTITSSLPPGCVGPPPGCLSNSMTVPRSAGAATVIGAGVGGAVGAAASLILIFSSHHFYLDAGAPVDMVLPKEVSLKQSEIAQAVRQSAAYPAFEQPVEPRPVAAPPIAPAPASVPTTPAPPIVIPGTVGPDGVPGPPTIIPQGSGTP